MLSEVTPELQQLNRDAHASMIAKHEAAEISLAIIGEQVGAVHRTARAGD